MQCRFVAITFNDNVINWDIKRLQMTLPNIDLGSYKYDWCCFQESTLAVIVILLVLQKDSTLDAAEVILKNWKKQKA